LGSGSTLVNNILVIYNNKINNKMSTSYQPPVYKVFTLYTKYLNDGTISKIRDDTFINIDIEKTKQYDKNKIVSYLESATEISMILSPCKNEITNEYLPYSLMIYTDGEWEWYNNLPTYILHHNVCIPDDWLTKMKRLHYIPLPVRYGTPFHSNWIVYILKHIPWFFKWLRAW
jgi:hypothetical protein